MTKKEFQSLLNKYVSGLASPEEEELLLEWYDSFEDEVIPAANIPTPDDERRLYENIRTRLTATRKRIHRVFPAGRVAASIAFFLLASGLAFYFYDQGKAQVHTDEKIVLTPKGRKQKLLLPDGTLVWLNADSRLDIPKSFGAGKREVILKGQAYFQVKHGSSPVFIVHTADADVSVLGTIFDVRAYPADKKTEISLVEGAVRVDVPKEGKKFLLHPDQKVVVDKSAGSTAELLQHTHAETGWTAGILSFNNRRFDDLAVDLERWFNIRIVFKTDKAKSFRFTGTLNDASLDTVMEALMLSQHFNYRKEHDSLLVVY